MKQLFRRGIAWLQQRLLKSALRSMAKMPDDMSVRDMEEDLADLSPEFRDAYIKVAFAMRSGTLTGGELTAFLELVEAEWGRKTMEETKC